jgi:putative membrane protein
MRFMFRWIANAISFYLALYLVDSLIAPRFLVEAVWVAVILAVVLGLLNSLIRPLHMIKNKPWYAVTVAVTTVLVNALILQLFIWAGAPLTSTHFVWVLVMAAFVTLLGGVLNWLIGFKAKEKPSTIIRERRAARSRGEDGAKAGAKKARARG